MEAFSITIPRFTLCTTILPSAVFSAENFVSLFFTVLDENSDGEIKLELFFEFWKICLTIEIAKEMEFSLNCPFKK